jgi:hypothetical protein
VRYSYEHHLPQPDIVDHRLEVADEMCVLELLDVESAGRHARAAAVKPYELETSGEPACEAVRTSPSQLQMMEQRRDQNDRPTFADDGKGDVEPIARPDVLDRWRVHGAIMRLRDAVVAGADAGLGAVDDACLVEEVPDVAAHGVEADHEGVGDLLVGLACMPSM